VAGSRWAPPILAPSKIICVGLNYQDHILEMGRGLPEYPTLFAKYPESLIGPYDTIIVPGFASYALDWEAELAIVIGSPARLLGQTEARAAIASYTALNDISLRDYQNRTPEWLQGKTLEGSCPIGPVVVAADEYSLGTQILTMVDDELKQRSTTDNLVFEPSEPVSYVSQIVTLNPGDIIATGTPGGVGHAQTPPTYLRDGSVVTTSIEGIGTLKNAVQFLP
jgi:acylpyruvate hydrolase